jgi:hypothetical protein
MQRRGCPACGRNIDDVLSDYQKAIEAMGGRISPENAGIVNANITAYTLLETAAQSNGSVLEAVQLTKQAINQQKDVVEKALFEQKRNSPIEDKSYLSKALERTTGLKPTSYSPGGELRKAHKAAHRVSPAAPQITAEKMKKFIKSLHDFMDGIQKEYGRK